MKKGLIKKMLAVSIITVMLLSCFTTSNVVKAQGEPRLTSTYGVGGGTHWPDQVFAPFVDMCLTTQKPEYNINQTPYLPKLSEDTGIKFFNLGFIQATSSIEKVVNGTLEWGWGGMNSMSETGKHSQYIGLKQSIKDLRDIGGDVIISFGGLNGTPFWMATTNEDLLVETYKELINGYGLTRIDLDIEGTARDKGRNEINARAIKRVQDETGVEIALTVPVLPDGLTPLEIGLMDAYLTAGVDIKMVNIMAMCYGSATLLPGENYGTGSLRAIDSTAKQIQDCYKKYGSQDISMAEAYRKVGVTTSVGLEGAAHPVFTTDWTRLVVDHAKEKGIGMTSFWSLNRDSQLQANSGITGPYEHSKINMSFGTQVPNPNGNFMPKFYGVKNKVVGVNRNFNPMNGVMVIDPEDGELTDKVKVEGNVNTAIPGEYNLIYSVADSKGKIAKIQRKVTVSYSAPENTVPKLSGIDDKLIFVGGKFDKLDGVQAIDAEDGNISMQLKIEGNVNTNKIGNYKVKYSITDSDGVTISKTITVTVGKVPPHNATVYDPTKVYEHQTEYVVFKGKIYQCKWWIVGKDPGTDAAWSYVEDYDSGVDDNQVLDLATAAGLYNLQVNEIGFDSTYDLNVDGIIDIYDLVLVAKNL